MPVIDGAKSTPKPPGIHHRDGNYQTFETATATEIQVRGLTRHFPVRSGVLLRTTGQVHAADDVSFDLNVGETLGLVGESGCGKSTVGKTLLRLYEPTSGAVLFEGRDIASMNKAELRRMRRDVQIILQDPFESLNARHTIGKILEEPFIIHRLGSTAERRRRVAGLLEKVDRVLEAAAANRFPHEFSGGQRQRIGIARAIATPETDAHLNPNSSFATKPYPHLMFPFNHR